MSGMRGPSGLPSVDSLPEIRVRQAQAQGRGQFFAFDKAQHQFRSELLGIVEFFGQINHLQDTFSNSSGLA